MQKVNNQAKKKAKGNKKWNEYRETESQNNSDKEVEGMKKKE